MCNWSNLYHVYNNNYNNKCLFHTTIRYSAYNRNCFYHTQLHTSLTVFILSGCLLFICAHLKSAEFSQSRSFGFSCICAFLCLYAFHAYCCWFICKVFDVFASVHLCIVYTLSLVAFAFFVFLHYLSLSR